MDIQTKDGILLRNVPDGTPDEAIKARIEQIRAQAPAPEQGVMGKLGDAALQGFRTGGPMGAIAGLVTPGMDAISNAISEGGYKAGGAVTDLTGSPAAGYAANVATQALPAVAGGYAGSLIGRAGNSLAEKLMQMSLKPSPTLGPAKQAAAVKTMLTADVGNLLPGANVTSGGIEQLQTKRQALGDAVNSLLAKSPETVNKYDVAQAAQSAIDRAGNQVAPISDTNAVVSAIDEFLHRNPKVPSATPAQVIPPQTVQSSVLNASGQPFTQTIPGRTIPASGTNEIPVALANELKQGTYASLGDKAYKGTELKSADVYAQKDLARGLRQQIERKVPEVAPLNAEQSQLINAIKAAISRDAISKNKDPIGLGFIAGNPIAAAGFAANRSEYIKSLVARLLYSTGGPAATGLGAGVGGVYANQQAKQQ